MEKIRLYGEKLKNKVIQREEFIVKENRRHNISVLINHHKDFDSTTYDIIIFKELMKVY